MKREIIYQGQSIAYEVIRKNVKHIHLRVESDLSVCVSASKTISDEALEKLIMQKADWICRMQEKQSQRRELLLASQMVNQYQNGGHVAFLGQAQPLYVITDGKCGWQLTEEGLKVIGCHNEEAIRLQVTHFYREMCILIFEEINELVYQAYFAPQNVPKALIKVKPLSASWGRCHIQKRYIVLNERLIRASVPCIISVIVHEYMHFIFPNHSKHFYDSLKSLLPQYETLTEQLALQVAWHDED